MHRWISAGFSLFLFAGLAFPQLQFDIVSIKPSDPSSTASNSLYTDHSGGLHVENYPLRGIILFAWDLRDFELLGAPGWTDTTRYDIIAKNESGSTGDDQFRERIRSLLANRFGMAVHHETKQLTSYVLSIAKGGPRLKAVTRQGEQYGFRGGHGHNQGIAITMPMFAKELARFADRPVIDRTGLTGNYDYLLVWSPDSDANGTGPSLFTALQEQLGLRLESTKAPVDVVVLDHVGHPSEN